MEYRIPARYETELYISKAGNICLKQDDPMESAPHIVSLEPNDVPKVIQWLQQLYDERKRISDEAFVEGGDGESVE